MSGRFIVIHGHRLFFTVGNGLDAVGRQAQHLDHAFYCLGTTLAQRQVVLARTAFIGMSFEHNLDVLVGGQIGGMCFNDGAILLVHGAAVEGKVHAPLGKQVGLGVQGFATDIRAGAGAGRIGADTLVLDGGLGALAAAAGSQEERRNT